MGRSLTSSPPLGAAPLLEESLRHKDDVVGLDEDIASLVASPHHLINITPYPFLLFAFTPKDIHPASRGQRGKPSRHGDGPDHGQVLRILDRSRRLDLPLQIDEIGQGRHDRVAGLELDILSQVALLRQLGEVDWDLLVLPEHEAPLRIGARRDSPHQRYRLEEGQIPCELHGAGLAEAAHKVNGPALDFLDDNGDGGALDRLGIDGGQVILELLHGLARCLDLAHEGERRLSVRSHEDDLVQILVVPDLHLEDAFRTDDEVLALDALSLSLSRDREHRYRPEHKDHKRHGAQSMTEEHHHWTPSE